MRKTTELTQKIKAEARRLGFQLVGVTSPNPPPHLDVYEAWLAAGRHADMAWIATERARRQRAAPREIFPECESILVLGSAYAPPAAKSGAGLVAAYALGGDYHDVLPPLMQQIVQFIEQQVGRPVPHRWYTDTGPILEREMAQRAGLGWIGKNTCLIHPKIGSYFFLAEILLGIPLALDAPFTSDRCGTCTRCIQACPTGCILPDRTIDSNRCISYLTIENKGDLPENLRPKLGDWIFGCDVCQQVCPWNRKSDPPPLPAFKPRPDLPPKNWLAELSLTPQAFNRKFKGSPLKRAKRRGYLRNIATMLGNAGEPQTIPALAQALSDFEPLARSHAAWALGQVGGAAARAILLKALNAETDSAVLTAIQRALDRIA